MLWFVRNSPDISGLQPSCSTSTSSSQADGLGFLILRRWRGGKMGLGASLARQTGQRPPNS